jgi:peptidoglycan/LPS O-acetylase OafA/YrhL
MLPIAAWRDLDTRRPSTGDEILDPLDGVRGLAVAIVVASHTDGLLLGNQGIAGVLLFFCLSAFLLTLPLARDPALLTRRRELWRYAKRRIGRIVPLYYVVLAAWYGLYRADFETLGLHLAFVEARLHFWTIPQELLFYLLLPWIALLRPFAFRGALLPTLAALGAGAIAASWLLRWKTFALGVFLTGMAFAYLAVWPPLAAALRRPGPRRALEGAGYAALAGLWLGAPSVLRLLGLGGLPGDKPLCQLHPGSFALLCGVLILASVRCEGSGLQRLFCWRPLRALGFVSYSIYLTSPFVSYALFQLGLRVQHGNALFALVLALSYALALATYAGIERRFIVSRRAQPGVLPAATAAGR